MSRAATGWAFVALQVLLLVMLVLLPGRNDWPTPAAIEAVGLILIVAGAALILVAATHLGRSLTPTPVPVADGQLSTDGLYKFMRHPIYTGVLTIVAGLAIRSGSLITLAIAGVTVVFFNQKATWEERQLADHYPDYADYAARTPRFVPRLR